MYRSISSNEIEKRKKKKETECYQVLALVVLLPSLIHHFFDATSKRASRTMRVSGSLITSQAAQTFSSRIT